MHFIVYSNFDRQKDIEVVDKVACYLKSKTGISYTFASYRESGFLDHSFLRLSDCVAEGDIIIVVGGDGTVLRAASDIANARLEKPILAINRGQCGFLTDIEPDEIEQAIDLVIDRKYKINKRMMFKVLYKNTTFYSLNEVVIYKGEITRPIVVEAEFDETHRIASTQGDGAYVCTPTGSTAYSLSCGGPILSPDTKGIVLGAICAHTLVNRPMVVSDEHTLVLRLGKDFNDARLMIDGDVKARIYDSTPVIIEKAEISASFISIKETDFYKKLLEKLNRWSVTTYREIENVEDID